MKLVKLLPFYGLFLITLSCSNQINSINPSNINSLSIENGINIINEIKSNNVEKVKELLSKNLNLKVQNLNGETPLMIASANGNKEIVELICNKYKFDNISKLPEFDWKKANSYVGIVSPIYNKYTNYSDDYKSFINYTNSKSFNKSALLFAIENGHTDIAKYLISEGSDLSVKDSNQNNLIFYSLILRNTEFID
ncbi:MAG: ankyrin repeat domain-containing protein, partial [Candidatus Sericytochromatia bacterium]